MAKPEVLAQAAPAALPPDFADRMAAALGGPPPLKARTYDELTALADAQPVLAAVRVRREL